MFFPQLEWTDFRGKITLDQATLMAAAGGRTFPTKRNLSTTLRHCRLRFTEQSLLFWMSRVG